MSRFSAPHCVTVMLVFFLCFAQAGQPKPADVTNERAIDVDADPGNWILHGRDHGEQRFSPLEQINDGNVAKLGVAWYANIPSIDGLVATPLVRLLHAANSSTANTFVCSVTAPMQSKDRGGRSRICAPPAIKPMSSGRRSCSAEV